METITLFDIRGEFGCNRILDRFIEQDLKFESFGNLGLKYTLIFFHRFLYPSLFPFWSNYINFIISGGLHDSETSILQICFIIFRKLLRSCKIFPMLLQISLIFLISFLFLSKVLHPPTHPAHHISLKSFPACKMELQNGT